MIKNPKFKGLLSITQAGKLYNKSESTLRRNISNGKFIEGEDCIKLGTYWIFDKKALDREYGKTDKPNKTD